MKAVISVIPSWISWGLLLWLAEEISEAATSPWWSLPGGAVSKGPTCQSSRLRNHRFDLWFGEMQNVVHWRSVRQYPVVDVTGDRSKVRCCKEQYCIGTWNVRSMNQGKLELVIQDMARVNVNILGIGELKWTGMGEFNSDDHYIYYCRQESLRRNGVAIMVKKRVWNAVLGCNLKNDRKICLFTRQTIQYHGNPSLCPNQ